MAKKDKAPAKKDAPAFPKVEGYAEWKPADLARQVERRAAQARWR
jgi:hypothetical protein